MKFNFITKCSVIALTIGLASAPPNVNLLPNAYASKEHACNCTSETTNSETPKAVKLDHLKKIISEQLSVKVDEIKDESKFIEDLGADSLDTVELVMAIEEKFDIEIPDEDAEKLLTVNDVYIYLNGNHTD